MGVSGRGTKWIKSKHKYRLSKYNCSDLITGSVGLPWIYPVNPQLWRSSETNSRSKHATSHLTVEARLSVCAFINSSDVMKYDLFSFTISWLWRSALLESWFLSLIPSHQKLAIMTRPTIPNPPCWMSCVRKPWGTRERFGFVLFFSIWCSIF